MKTVKEIRNEYFDNNEKLSKESLEILKAYLEDADSKELSAAISFVTDARLIDLVPLVAKHLEHENDFIREIVIGSLLGRLKIAEYAEKGLKVATEDPYSNVRGLAAMSLGAVINKVDVKLRNLMASYLYEVMISSNYDNLHKQSAYDSILEALEIPITEWPAKKLNPDISKLINLELVKNFKDKYHL